MTNFTLNTDDLMNNPSPRVPICFCLDASPSMSGRREWGAAPGTTGSPIDELNQGVATFFDALREDPVAHRSAEVAIVSYSSTTRVERQFGTIGDEQAPVIQLHHGGTYIGSAVETCLDMLEARKESYRKAGVEYYQPWLVLMTDGQPTDFSHLQAAPRAASLVEDRKLTLFPIGVGSGADLDVLATFSPVRSPLRLKDMKFQELFEWLSASVTEVSRSQPGQGIAIDIEGLKGWAEL